jgi:pyruvate dehydrogenase E2 component (dihydrolipoamide acetyltransferase)
MLPAKLFWTIFVGVVAFLWWFSSSGMTIRQKIMISTWAPQENSTAHVKAVMTVDKTVQFLKDYKERTGTAITMTHLTGRAIALAAKDYPALNGRILWGRLLPCTDCDICFLVSVEGGSNLWVHTMRQVDRKSLKEIAEELARSASKIRQGKDANYKKMMDLARILPTFLLRPMTQFLGFLSSGVGLNLPQIGIMRRQGGTISVTSMGSLGLEEGYPPLSPFLWNPVIALLGAVKDKPVVINGKVEVRPQCNLIMTIDHRFLDGQHGTKILKRTQELIENPEILLQIEQEAAAAPAAPAATAAPASSSAPVEPAKK